MMIFLILAPYGAFAGLMLVTSAAASLLAAAAICVAVIAWDAIGGRSFKILGTGSAILFAALGGYVALVDSSWSVAQVKLAVDAGMLAISLGSIAMRTPFTLQIAREMVDGETLALPGFIKANYVITWAWTLSFALMMVANVMLIYVPGLPLWIGLAIAFAARNSALYFTKWYPQHRRTKFSTPAASV
jgi:hypothetical protein